MIILCILKAGLENVAGSLPVAFRITMRRILSRGCLGRAKNCSMKSGRSRSTETEWTVSSSFRLAFFVVSWCLSSECSRASMQLGKRLPGLKQLGMATRIKRLQFNPLIQKERLQTAVSGWKPSSLSLSSLGRCWPASVADVCEEDKGLPRAWSQTTALLPA